MNEEQILKIAVAAHENNKAFCESIGDDSQKDWNDAPDWQRESSVKQVKFHLDNPQAPASSSHDSWMQEKIDNGWVYGPERDNDKKIHPCIVPFDELPTDQQLKDYIFKYTVETGRRLLG